MENFVKKLRKSSILDDNLSTLGGRAVIEVTGEHNDINRGRALRFGTSRTFGRSKVQIYVDLLFFFDKSLDIRDKVFSTPPHDMA